MIQTNFPRIFLPFAFTRQDIWIGALNSGTLIGYVNIQHNLVACRHFSSFLIMQHSSLGMMIFLLLQSSFWPTSFYIMNASMLWIRKCTFKLPFIIINLSNCLMLRLTPMLSRISPCSHLKIRNWCKNLYISIEYSPLQPLFHLSKSQDTPGFHTPFNIFFRMLSCDTVFCPLPRSTPHIHRHKSPKISVVSPRKIFWPARSSKVTFDLQSTRSPSLPRKSRHGN